ncbi:hypothetical protein N7451_001618 [Penicillium sp. IBT 35674x]|nr:hypothetical protein N7451_001618 [Penicillium sp. IBT 35674x]
METIISKDCKSLLNGPNLSIEVWHRILALLQSTDRRSFITTALAASFLNELVAYVGYGTFRLMLEKNIDEKDWAQRIPVLVIGDT